MDSFNFDNLTPSINAQLNQGIERARKGNSHLQTGKKINKASDDVGAFSVNSKINSEITRKQKSSKSSKFLSFSNHNIVSKVPYFNSHGSIKNFF